MTKKELQEIKHFLIKMHGVEWKGVEMKIESVIDVYCDIYKWFREIYHTQGKEKLEDYNENL